MKKLILLLLFTISTSAQTVVNFDVPACVTGSLPTVFNSITWSQTPSGWSCEGAWNADSTRHIFFTSSSQKQASLTFASPQVFTSVQVFADTVGTLKITDDANQSIIFNVAKVSTLYTVTTGWTKASNTVMFNYSAGWAAGFDNFTFTTSTPPPPPTITGVTVVCSSLAVVFGGTSNCSALVTGTGAFDNGVTWSASDGVISLGGIFTAPSLAETVTIRAISLQDTTQSGTVNIDVSRPPINLDVTLLWDDNSPIAGTVQVQQMIGNVNTTLTTLTLNVSGNIKGPVLLDLSQTDPIIISLTLTDPTGKFLGLVSENVPKAMFNGVAKVVASLTVSRTTLTLKGISWVSQ